MPVGLMNLGNSCFMNAALQSFFAISEDLHLFKSNVTDAFPLASSLKQLAIEVHDAHKPVHPVRFHSTFINQFPFFGSGDQQDAFEFVTLLLDALHEETKAPSSPAALPVAFNLTALTSRQLSIMAKASQGVSPVAANFQGQLLIKTLGSCGCASGKFEPFFGLSLPIVSTEGQLIGNLQDAISEFQRPQPLVGEDRWQCDACNSRVDAETRSEIFRLPDVLILNLKRFRFTRAGRIEKLSHLVEYPSDLEILGNNFRLFAVVLHSGSVSSGHYTALARDLREDVWRKFNDQHVRDNTEITSQPDAYILFYQRTLP